MAKVIFRQEAVNDLNDIWIYTFKKWSEIQADRYYEILKTACAQVGENPEIGKVYDGIANNLFGLRAGNHIIFYVVISLSEIEIIRILHQRMDIKSRLSE